MTTKNIALIAVMTAVTCVLASLSIPMGQVPISLTTVAIYSGRFDQDRPGGIFWGKNPDSA